MRKQLIAACIAALVPMAAAGGGGGFIGATEPTQLMNNAELVGINAEAVQQVSNQVTQIARRSPTTWPISIRRSSSGFRTTRRS